jgi:hypothetical protein
MRIDLEELWKTEQDLKKRVEEAPTNIKARSDLANCLVLLAAYKAGQEAILGNTPRIDQCDDPGLAIGRSSSDLFKEHLWHMRVLSVLPKGQYSVNEGSVSPVHSIAFHLATGLDAEVKEKHDKAMRRMISDISKTKIEPTKQNSKQ